MNKRQLLQAIGRNIRAVRLARGLTQESLAEVLGIHWKTLGYIESGKRDFGASVLTMLILRMKVSSAELLKGINLNDAEITTILEATKRKRKPRTTSS